MMPAKRNIGDEILEGLGNATAHARGERGKGRVNPEWSIAPRSVDRVIVRVSSVERRGGLTGRNHEMFRG